MARGLPIKLGPELRRGKLPRGVNAPGPVSFENLYEGAGWEDKDLVWVGGELTEREEGGGVGTE